MQEPAPRRVQNDVEARTVRQCFVPVVANKTDWNSQPVAARVTVYALRNHSVNTGVLLCISSGVFS